MLYKDDRVPKEFKCLSSVAEKELIGFFVDHIGKYLAPVLSRVSIESLSFLKQ